MTQKRTLNKWLRLRTKLFPSSSPSPSPNSFLPASPISLSFSILHHNLATSTFIFRSSISFSKYVFLHIFTITLFLTFLNPASSRSSIPSFEISSNDISQGSGRLDLSTLNKSQMIPGPRSVRGKRQAVQSSTEKSTTSTPASQSTTTTACVCPSSSTSTTGSSSTSTTVGTTTTDGLCVCPGQQVTPTTSEVESSTDLPINSNSGRRLRQELLDMEFSQSQTKFEAKLFKNIPFLKLYF